MSTPLPDQIWRERRTGRYVRIVRLHARSDGTTRYSVAIRTVVPGADGRGWKDKGGTRFSYTEGSRLMREFEHHADRAT